MTTLARLAADTSVAFSIDRENQQGDQLEASFGYLHRAGILRGGVVTKTAANEVSLAANTLIFSKGVVWDIGNNVVDPGPPEVLLGANPLALTVAGTPSTSIYIYVRLVRTAADPLAPTALDTYLAVLSYSASATPASDEYIPLAVVPLDGSGNITGSIGAVMGAPAGPKYLHQWPNWGYRQVSVAGTGVYTATSEDLAGGGHEYTGALTGNRQVELVPEQGRLLPVLNSTTGAFTLTIRTPGTTGIVLARLSAALLWVTPAGVVVLGTVDLTLAGAAPIGAQYLTLAADGTLTVERVLTPGPSLQGTDAGAGAAYTLDVKGNAGTPEGAVTAAVGTLCRDTTNGDVYVKHTGAGNTGWRRLVESGEAAGGDLTGTFPSPSVATSFPRWVKVTKLFSDLAAAALTNDIEVYSLPAGGVIHGVKIKHSAAFTGGAIASYTLSVGISGTLAKYASAFSVFGAPSNTNFQVSATIGSENHGAATSIRLAATSTGANLNAATAGSVDVWILVSEAL